MSEYTPIGWKQACSLYEKNAQGIIFDIYTCEENRLIWRAENDVIKIGISQDKWTPKSDEQFNFKAPKTLQELIERFNLTILNKVTSEQYSYNSIMRALDEAKRTIRKRKN